MSSKRLSLAEQIAQLAEAAPVDIDPEDAQSHAFDPDPNADPSNALDEDVGREHYVSVGPSTLRNHHLPPGISAPKYDGVRTSRRTLHSLSQSSDTPSDAALEEDSGDEDGGVLSRAIYEVADENDAGSGDQEDAEPSSSSNDEAGDDTNTVTRPSAQAQALPADDLSTSLRQKRAEDITKGRAIARQLTLWDTLLDARIRLQKAAAAARRLPLPTHAPQFVSEPACGEALGRLLDAAGGLSEEMFELREDLLRTTDSLTPPPRKRRRLSPTPTPLASYDSTVREHTAAAAALAHAAHPHLVRTLQKWSGKIQAVAPGALLPARRNAFKAAGPARSAAQLVDEALADPARAALRKTRVRRAGVVRLAPTADTGGVEDANEEDEEMFDDTEFYQQLLRDVIDSRGQGTAGAGDAEWRAAQKQKKARKKVDTRASKGRKLRYEVHEKLQNFMTGVPVVGAWHEEQVDELFASLLGRGVGAGGAGGDEEGGREGTVPEAMSGFRVFG